MIKAYINYPNIHVTLHNKPNCPSIGQQQKDGQRIIRIDIGSLSTELDRFKTSYYRFGANASINDMWLYVDFNNSDFERAVVEYVRGLLSEHYTPFDRAKVIQHC